MIKRCKLDARYGPIQTDWSTLEDACVDYRRLEPVVFWPRYQMMVFGLESERPTLEVLRYEKDVPVIDGPSEPPIESGGGILLEGEVAREYFSFLSAVCRKEHPKLADWLAKKGI